MNKQIIKQVAWVGDEYVSGAISGVVLNFHGLGHTGMRTTPTTEELAWADKGGLCVFPYYGPWSWMNRQARAFVDELVDSIYACYQLPAHTPLVTVGGSMGGCSSLLYARYARRPVRGCVANCPVCDMKYHFSERPELPTSMRQAFACYDEDMESVFREQSPLAQVAQMPDIPYLLIHGGQDPAVAKSHHSDPMVAAMRAQGLNVRYLEVPRMQHCGPLPLEVLTEQVEFVSRLLDHSVGT